MTLKVPFSSLDTLTSNPFTRARYPNVAFFLQCNETTGNKVYDSVYHGYLTCSSLSFLSPGLLLPTTAVNAPLTNGSLISPGTKKVLVFSVGDPGTIGTVTYGHATAGNGSRINILLPNPSIYDGAASDAGTAFGGTGLRGLGMSIDVAGNINCFRCLPAEGASGYTLAGTTPTTNVSALNGVQSYMSITNQTSLAGYAVFLFDSLPSDIAQACMWMTHQWARGPNHKVIWPGWLGGAA